MTPILPSQMVQNRKLVSRLAFQSADDAFSDIAEADPSPLTITSGQLDPHPPTPAHSCKHGGTVSGRRVGADALERVSTAGGGGTRAGSEEPRGRAPE
jgi:hypothetical protein